MAYKVTKQRFQKYINATFKITKKIAFTLLEHSNF